MKKYLLLAFSFNVIHLSICQSSYPAASYAFQNETIHLTSASLANNYNFLTTGAGINWSFPGLNGNTQNDLLFVNPTTTGFTKVSFNYIFNTRNVNSASSNGISIEIGNKLSFSNQYFYYLLTNTGLSIRAQSADITINGLKVSIRPIYTSPDVVYNFPINYLDKDSSISTYRFNIPTILTFDNWQKRKNTVDSWGNLTTPFASYSNCLRMKTELEALYTSTVAGIALPADTLFTNEYKWFEPTKKYPVLVVKTQKVLGIEITQSIDYLDKKTYYQPTALYAFLPLTPIGGEEVVFQNLSINADKYLWNFGDPSAGPNNTSSEKNPSFIYSTPGTYLTTLTAFSGTITSSLSLPLTVFANSTILSTFSYSPSDSCSYSKTILFQNNSTPNASNYAWNFGDGTTSTLQNPLHIYTTSGLYKVKLRVSNPSETLIDSSFKIVKINDPVLIQGITPSATLCGGALAFMNVSASGSGLKYNWNNNNKNQGFYTSIPGKYFVTVTGNCSSRISNTSTLLFQPTTEILAQPASVTLTGGASTLIGVTAAGAQLTYLWNTNAKTNTILTSIAGSYIVTVSGACGQVVSNPALVTTVAGMVSPPKPVLTVIAFNASKVYGEENPIFSGTIIGLVTGDNVEVVFGLVGTSIVPTVTGTDLNKYNLYSLNGTLTIIRADQTVSIAGINTVTLSGLNQIVSIIGASNSGLPVSYFIQSNPMQIATISGNLIDVYKIGTITVTGIQNGNENYNQSLPTSTVFVVTTSMSGLISKVDLAFSETSINVFPNPNAGSFTIFVNNAADFKLLSIDGVEKTRGVLNVGENQISAPFPKGIYFLKVGSTIKKLIIN